MRRLRKCLFQHEHGEQLQCSLAEILQVKELYWQGMNISLTRATVSLGRSTKILSHLGQNISRSQNVTGLALDS